MSEAAATAPTHKRAKTVTFAGSAADAADADADADADAGAGTHAPSAAHPRIQPLGAQLLAKSAPSCRHKLGSLAALPDLLLLQVLQQLGARALLRVQRTCRAGYAFGSHEELWCALVLTEREGRWRFCADWQATYRAGAGGGGGGAAAAGSALVVRGVYSDLLFQPHLCASTPLARRWTRAETILRRDASSLSAAEFAAEFEGANLPLLLQVRAALRLLLLAALLLLVLLLPVVVLLLLLVLPLLILVQGGCARWSSRPENNASTAAAVGGEGEELWSMEELQRRLSGEGCALAAAGGGGGGGGATVRAAAAAAAAAAAPACAPGAPAPPSGAPADHITPQAPAPRPR